MQSQYVEALVGTFVLGLAVFILWFGYTRSGTNLSEGYTLSAYFNRIDGINVGNDVKMGGIKIGTVKKQSIDQKTFMAKVELSIQSEITIPNDSSIAVVSDGLLGNKYLDISPGGSEENYKNGEVIEHTQSSINLESLIGHLVFNQDKKKT
jgi:phospholipid/cholesterol/gamma-HCH transport system substrate-binding protein